MHDSMSRGCRTHRLPVAVSALFIAALATSGSAQMNATFVNHWFSPGGTKSAANPATFSFSGTKNGIAYSGSLTLKACAPGGPCGTVAGVLGRDFDTGAVVMATPVAFTVDVSLNLTLPLGQPSQPPPTYTVESKLGGFSGGYAATTKCPAESGATTVGPGAFSRSYTFTCSASVLGTEWVPTEDRLGARFDATIPIYVNNVKLVELWTVTRYLVPEASSSVTAISPLWVSTLEALQPQALPVTITGTGFKQGAKVQIELTPFGLAMTDVVVTSPTMITAKIRADGRYTGTYDVVVTNPDGIIARGRELFVLTDIEPAIEVNQGVPMRCQERPCIADHDTWVRVRLVSHEALHLAAAQASGRLHVTRNGTAIEGSPFRPQPTTMPLRRLFTDHGELRAAVDSLNFSFDDAANLGEGTYDFKFELDPRNPATAPSGTADTKKYLSKELNAQRFQRSDPKSAFRLSFIIDRAPRAKQLYPIDVASLADMVRTAFPISRDLVKVGVSPSTMSFGDFADFDDAIAAVAARGKSDSKYVKTYAVMVTDNAKMDTPGASSCTASGFWGFYCAGNGAILLWEGPANSQAVVAHEIGHHMLLGDTYLSAESPGSEQRSKHNPATTDCTVLGDGCAVEHGHLDTMLGTVSVRRESGEVSSFLKRDLMGNSARENRWIDLRTWNYLYGKFNPATSAGTVASTASEGSFVEISGSLDRSGHVKLDPVARVADDDVNPDGGDYVVELRDASGTAISSQRIDPSFTRLHQITQAKVAAFRVALPWSTSAARVVVRRNTSELASIAVSKSAPSVKLTWPNGGETVGSTARLLWQGSDADGDPLTYDVLYSTDGKDWSTLAAGLTATEFTWDTAYAAGSKTAALMVVANDGWHEASDTADAPFTVPGKSPVVRFDPAVSTVAAASGQAVMLRAEAYDLEDGRIAPASIAWSNGQTALGTGRTATLANLAIGTHTVLATAKDKDGTTGTATILVTIYRKAPKQRSVRR